MCCARIKGTEWAQNTVMQRNMFLSVHATGEFLKGCPCCSCTSPKSHTFLSFSLSKMGEFSQELQELPRRALLASAFITYLASAPEDLRRERIKAWMEIVGVSQFDLRRFLSTESEQLMWKAEGLPSDELSMENAMVILQVKDYDVATKNKCLYCLSFPSVDTSCSDCCNPMGSRYV